MGTTLTALTVGKQEIELAQNALTTANWGRGNNPAALMTVARISVAYGLDPLCGEVLLMSGNPYVTVAGLRRYAIASDRLDGMELEPFKMPNAADGEHWWKCTVHIKGSSHPYVEYGRAGGPGETNPVAKKNPSEMARTRAIGRALKLCSGIGLPCAEEHPDYGTHQPRFADGNDAMAAVANKGKKATTETVRVGAPSTPPVAAKPVVEAEVTPVATEPTAEAAAVASEDSTTEALEQINPDAVRVAGELVKGFRFLNYSKAQVKAFLKGNGVAVNGANVDEAFLVNLQYETLAKLSDALAEVVADGELAKDGEAQ